MQNHSSFLKQVGKNNFAAQNVWQETRTRYMIIWATVKDWYVYSTAAVTTGAGLNVNTALHVLGHCLGHQLETN